MPTVLRIRFPAGRYHATPWGHHVNEGHVEWPPSPWRLLRAMLSTGFAKLCWPAEGPPPIARSLVERLASMLPRYVLPRAALAHTRHYVDAEDKRPIIFDTWAHVGRSDLLISWNVVLPADERAVLADLANRLGYLGRSESWVEAESCEAPMMEPSAFPVDGVAPGSEWEAVTLLAPQSASDYAAWRDERAAPLVVATEPPPGRKMPAALSKKRVKALAPYPADLVACLCVETRWMQSHGWNRPPGSREVLYWVRSDVLEVGPPVALRPRGGSIVPFALLALSTPNRATGALPSIQRTVPQARLLHRALASTAGRLGVTARTAATLLGRAAPGAAPESGHTHAHVLHLDLDGDGRLDHVLVWARRGLDVEAQAVLRSLRRTWMKGGVGELQVALAGLGSAIDILALTGPLGIGIQAILGGSSGSRDWESETPFVPPRYLKCRGRNSLVGQVQAELTSHGLPACQVEVLSLLDDRFRRFRHFVLGDDRREPPVRAVFALHLRFSEPVHGPICLGYAAHQGLGRFALTGNQPSRLPGSLDQVSS